MIKASPSTAEIFVGRGKWRQATMLALAALACGLLLGGLSAWFLGSVALAGLTVAALSFNVHIPGALIRLFAVGRTAAKYGERVIGHEAALADQVVRRVMLFRAMADAPSARAKGWQFSDEAQLADYLDDVEDLDNGKLRVDLPTLAAGTGLASLLLATAILEPLALLPILGLGLAGAIAGVGLLKAGAPACRRSRALQRDGSQRLGLALSSVVPLQAEGMWCNESHAALDSLSQADQAMLAVDRRRAALDAIAALVGPVGLVSVIGAAWIDGHRGEALLMPAFFGFAWLALGEGMTGLSRIAVAHIRRVAARAEIARWTGSADPGSALSIGALPSRIAALELSHLPRRTPDGRAIASPMSLRLERGSPTVLSGASGCGKTSLLKQIAGWIGDDDALADGIPVTAHDRRMLCALCPHDAAILEDTVRANLFAAGASDAALWQALAAVEIDERVAQAGGLDAWITQDALSLGEAQRLNLARTWLCDRPVVLIDEPTEHLDRDQGARILARLIAHLSERILVVASHRDDARAGATFVRL